MILYDLHKETSMCWLCGDNKIFVMTLGMFLATFGYFKIDETSVFKDSFISFYHFFFLSTTSLPLPLQKEDLHLFFGFSPLSGIISTKTISVSEGFVKYCLIIFRTCGYTFCREVLFLMFGSSVIPCLARLDMNGKLRLVNTEILQHVFVTED